MNEIRDSIIKTRKELFDSYSDTGIDHAHFVYVATDGQEYECDNVRDVLFWINRFGLGISFKVILEYTYGFKTRRYPVYESEPNTKRFILGD